MRTQHPYYTLSGPFSGSIHNLFTKFFFWLENENWKKCFFPLKTLFEWWNFKVLCASAYTNTLRSDFFFHYRSLRLIFFLGLPRFICVSRFTFFFLLIIFRTKKLLCSANMQRHLMSTDGSTFFLCLFRCIFNSRWSIGLTKNVKKSFNKNRKRAKCMKRVKMYENRSAFCNESASNT